METELIDETVLEAIEQLPLPTWNKLQNKVFRYLVSENPGDGLRHIALKSLIIRGAFNPGASFEEVKQILADYNETQEVREHFCVEGREKFKRFVKSKPKPPEDTIRGTVGEPRPAGAPEDYRSNCGCDSCIRIRNRRARGY